MKGKIQYKLDVTLPLIILVCVLAFIVACISYNVGKADTMKDIGYSMIEYTDTETKTTFYVVTKTLIFENKKEAMELLNSEN